MKYPFITKEQALKIRETYPTPFYIYDEKAIRANIRATQKAFSWNKGYREYFAVKATPNPFILKIMKEEGCGVDCSSYNELLMSRACGFSGDDIMFSSNDTPAEDFVLAHDCKAIINFDDITHIDFASNLFKLPRRMSCRFNPGGLFKIANSIMDNPSESKYGFTREQLFDGFRKLKALGVESFGLHSFLASNTQTDDYYPTLAKILFSLAVELREKLDIKIDFINLSGGVGIPYRPEEKGNDIAVIGDGVRKAYEEILTPAGMGDVAIFTELGRFMLGPYGALVTTVIHDKQTYKHYLGTDACAANLMRPAMYGAYHHISVLGKENEPYTEKYDVTGGLCENNDKFAIDRMMPKTEIGDILFIHDAGAHGFSMGYNYNAKLRSAELMLNEDGSVKLIRRAETSKDYFATFDFSGLFDDIK